MVGRGNELEAAKPGNIMAGRDRARPGATTPERRRLADLGRAVAGMTIVVPPITDAAREAMRAFLEAEDERVRAEARRDLERVGDRITRTYPGMSDEPGDLRRQFLREAL